MKQKGAGSPGEQRSLYVVHVFEEESHHEDEAGAQTQYGVFSLPTL